jgi:hypothetical protein
MSIAVPQRNEPVVFYPESDGEPMGENTLQIDRIFKIKLNLDSFFRDDPNVFVAGNLFWYPVEGDPKVRTAPEMMVVFGRPKGYRGSIDYGKKEASRPKSFSKSGRPAIDKASRLGN